VIGTAADRPLPSGSLPQRARDAGRDVDAAPPAPRLAPSKGEIPVRKRFAGDPNPDLATLFARAATIRCVRGTLARLSIFTMPATNISHPSPNLTAYSTEGQVVLWRELDPRVVCPPLNMLPSLAQRVKAGLRGRPTYPDHPALAMRRPAA
jgi:vacuolar-type H+-ATPase subunit B/Vma2